MPVFDISTKTKLNDIDNYCENSIKSNKIFFNNGFTSVKLYKSFIKKGLLTYFYQTYLYVNSLNKFFYIIIPEESQNSIFFHYDFNRLKEFFQEKIDLNQKEVNKFAKYSWISSKNNLFMNILNENIEKYIVHSFTSDKNLDTILQETYLKSVNNQFCSISYELNLFQEHNIEDIIEKYLSTKLEFYKLSQISFAELFFGFLHPNLIELTSIMR